MAFNIPYKAKQRNRICIPTPPPNNTNHHSQATITHPTSVCHRILSSMCQILWNMDDNIGLAWWQPNWWPLNQRHPLQRTPVSPPTISTQWGWLGWFGHRALWLRLQRNFTAYAHFNFLTGGLPLNCCSPFPFLIPIQQTFPNTQHPHLFDSVCQLF